MISEIPRGQTGLAKSKHFLPFHWASVSRNLRTTCSRWLGRESAHWRLLFDGQCSSAIQHHPGEDDDGDGSRATLWSSDDPFQDRVPSCAGQVQQRRSSV